MAITRAAMVLLVVGLVVAVAQGAKEAAPAPAPAPDCSTVLLDMSSCLSYVQNGSKESKPDEACCQGLKTVIKKSANCLCEVLKESGSLGIAFNFTRATELPAACKVTTTALKGCAGFESPAPPPPKSSRSPKAAPPPSKATSPTLPPSPSAPATAGSNFTQNPSPSPAQSGAHAFLPSPLMLCAALVMIWLSN